MGHDRSIDTLPLDGGCLCLDFINTVHDRTVEDPFEYLPGYKEILDWAVKVELLTPTEKSELEAIAGKDPVKVNEAWGELISARELLYDLFLSVARNEKPDDSAQAQVNTLLKESMSQLELRVDDNLEGLQQWKSKSDLKFPLYPIVKSAYDLLTSNTPGRIKECGACGWLFLDKSKNKSRKWCSMESCGSNVKAKRYYYRQKANKDS